MKNTIFKLKKFFNKYELIAIIFIYLLTFLNDLFIFKNENPYSNYLYPFTNKNFILRYLILKIVILILINCVALGLKLLIKNRHNKKVQLFIGVFMAVFIVNFVFAILQFPGYFKGDVLHLFNFASKLEFVPWHNVYTSLIYMIAMSFIPHPIGVVIFTILLCSLTYGLIAYCCTTQNRKQNIVLCIVLVFISTILTNRTYSIWPFRTTFSTYFELILILLYINYKKMHLNKVALYIFTAFVITYRSENIFYIFLPLIILDIKSIKILFKNYIIIAMLMIIINVPQNYFLKQNYNKDYIIINTYSSLQYIYNSSYFNDLKEKDNITNVVSLEYLKKYGYHSYFELNYMKNGIATKLDCDKKTQNEFLNSFVKLIFKNKRLFLFNKINNFTSLFYNFSFFDNYQSINLSDKYFFENQYNDLFNHISKKYDITEKHYKFDQLNYDISFNFSYCLVGTIIITILCLLKNRKDIFLILLCMIMKYVVIIFMSPSASYFYFYYLYFINPFLIIILLCQNSNKYRSDS